MTVDYRNWQITPLGEPERRLLTELYAAWRRGQPLDRERALFSVVRSGVPPREAAQIEQRVTAAHDPALVRDRGGGALVPTLAGAIALYPETARDDLENLEELVKELHESYTPDLRSIPNATLAKKLGFDETQVLRAAELADVARSADSILLSQEALFWAPFEAFLARKVQSRREKVPVPPRLPINATPFQVRWSGLGPFRAPTTLDLTPITVLVGGNGAGKTTALAALDTLRYIALQDLHGAFLHAERLPADIDDLGLATTMELTRPGASTPEIVDWELVVGRRGRHHARSEVLRRIAPAERAGELARFDRGAGRWTDNEGRLVEHTMRPDQLALIAATTPAAHSHLMALRQHLMSWRVELATRAGLGGRVLLGEGENPEAAALWSSYLNDRAAFDVLRDHVRHVTGLRDLTVSDRQTELVLEDSSGVRVPATAASTGVVRVIEILAWLLAPAPPTLLAIDEIEHHLHGDLAARLIDVMRSVSHRMRIVLTTHSASVLRCVTPAEVRLVSRDPRGSSIVAVDHDPRLRYLAEAGDLGDLIQDGYFAGGL